MTSIDIASEAKQLAEGCFNLILEGGHRCHALAHAYAVVERELRWCSSAWRTLTPLFCAHKKSSRQAVLNSNRSDLANRPAPRLPRTGYTARAIRGLVRRLEAT